MSGRRTVTVAEIREDLDIGRTSVYRMFEDGTIPAVRMGGPGSRWIVFREAYERWLSGLEQQAGAA